MDNGVQRQPEASGGSVPRDVVGGAVPSEITMAPPTGATAGCHPRRSGSGRTSDGDARAQRQSRAGMLEAAEDAFLVDRAVDGDVAAFEVLVRRYAPLMRAYARRVTGSASDADDVLQEAFTQAWRQLADLNDGSVVKSWLMKITGHRSIDLLRRRREYVPVDESYDLADVAPGPEYAAAASSQMAALRHALDRMPEGQRQCWLLKEMGAQSYDEIAAQLGISSATVRGRLARARTTLMKEMEEWR